MLNPLTLVIADEPPKGAYLPPDYCVATDLPTYDEVQRLKMEEETRRETCLSDPEGLHHEDSLLGTDFVFFCSFFVAFLFNWIGFLLLMCFCQTIAGRYGALAGFGLSLAKWTLIVKHSTDLISADNSWLWWLILAFGVFICVRAVLQYIHVKREWHVLSHAAQERLIEFLEALEVVVYLSLQSILHYKIINFF
uniref:Nedd4 family interacting protein 1 n=1 Tax=Strigamia maritima TaxID=126957 RepID=T1JNH8_STRMM